MTDDNPYGTRNYDLDGEPLDEGDPDFDVEAHLCPYCEGDGTSWDGLCVCKHCDGYGYVDF